MTSVRLLRAANASVARVAGRTVATVGRRGLPRRPASSAVPVAPPGPPRFDVYTFVTHERLYAEMRASFEAAGFGAPDARFVRLSDDGRSGPSDPFELIRSLADAVDRPYVVLVHQDVRLDQEAGLVELVRALADLDARDPGWVAAGTAGGADDLGVVRRLRDPHGGSTEHDFPAPVVTLDENFLVFNRATVPRVSPGLSGFHFYGSDVALAARLGGGGVYVVDFPVTHLSAGRRGDDYATARDRFVEAWQSRVRLAVVRTPTDVLVLARNRLVRRVLATPRVHRWVMEWGRG